MGCTLFNHGEDFKGARANAVGPQKGTIAVPGPFAQLMAAGGDAQSADGSGLESLGLLLVTSNFGLLLVLLVLQKSLHTHTQKKRKRVTS